MKNYITELIDVGVGSVIDMSVDRVIMEDDIYRTDSKDASEIHDKLVDMLTEEQRAVFEDFIALEMSRNERACNLSYLVGVRNTIQFLSGVNALKDDSRR